MKMWRVLRAAIGSLVVASGWFPARATTPDWLIQIEHAIDDNPAEVFASAKTELAAASTDAARRHAETKLLAAAIEFEQQDAVKFSLPLARARVQAGGGADAWCVAAAAEPVLLWRTDDFDGSREAMNRAVAQARASGQDWCIARVTLIHGRLLQEAGRRGEAAKALQQALSYFESHAENTQAAATLADLGWLDSRSGSDTSTRAAVERLQAALALLPQPTPRRLGSVVHHNLGGVLLEAGDTVGARNHLDAAMQLARGLGDQVDTAFLATLLARVELREKRPAAALQQAAQAHRLFEQIGIEHMIHTTAAMMADAQVQLGRPAEALKTLEDTDALRRKLQSPEHDAAQARVALSAHARLGHLDATVEAADAFAGAVEKREQLARQRAVAEANAQFQVERREAENRRLRDQQAANASRQFWLGMSLLLALVLVALLVGLAGRQRRERLRLRVLAEVDELTGLPNRRALQESLREEMRRSQQHGAPFFLAICDIDHFKRVNDRFGHDVGDEALRSFAQAGLSALRNDDVFARFGGEEFVILIRGATSSASPAFERMARQLRQTVVPGMPEDEHLTFSMGVAAWAPGMTEAALFHAADQALYRAKQAGRARFEIADAGGAFGESITNRHPNSDHSIASH